MIHCLQNKQSVKFSINSAFFIEMCYNKCKKIIKSNSLRFSFFRMSASRHYLSPAMPTKYVVNLCITNFVINLILICALYFRDFNYLSFFSSLVKRLEYLFLFLYTHVSPIAAVMIPGNCFYSTGKILSCQLANIWSAYSHCFCDLF